MAEIICHHNGKYNIYNTISEAFRFRRGLSLEQIQQVIKNDLGNQGLRALPNRLERAHAAGHSAFTGETLDELLLCNRAGEGKRTWIRPRAFSGF